MQQVACAGGFTALMLDGTLIDYNETPNLFTTPAYPRTEACIARRLG